MKFKKNNSSKNNKAFTLIELLIVIAIIAILSSLIVVSIGNYRKRARNSKIDSDISMLKTALLEYQRETGGVPTSTVANDWCMIGVNNCLKELLDQKLLVTLPAGPEGKCSNISVDSECYFYYYDSASHFVSISGIKTGTTLTGPFIKGDDCDSATLAAGHTQRYCDGFML